MTRSLNPLFLRAVLICAFAPAAVFSEVIIPSNFKPMPRRPNPEPEVVVESIEVLDDCELEKICVEGQLYNAGGKTAYQVRLQIDFASTKYTKPRVSIFSKVDQTEMHPGDRQDFFVKLNRKVPYKHKGKQKTIEVGKYNFKVVPLWAAQKK